MGNLLRLPWKVQYGKLYDTSEYVDSIVDCEGHEVVETDCGVYGPTREQAEAIVMAMNVYFKDQYE